MTRGNVDNIAYAIMIVGSLFCTIYAAVHEALVFTIIAGVICALSIYVCIAWGE